MALVVPDQGEIILLQYLTGIVSAGSPTLHLFGGNTTPSDSTTLSGLQNASNAVTSSGYAFSVLASNKWTTTQSVSGVTTALYSEVTFTFNTDATVYGYYVTDSAVNNLLWVERFSGAPFQIPDGGGTITITPKVTLS